MGDNRANFMLFQSTRPRGARRCPAASTGRCRGFNPRAREGRDLVSKSTTATGEGVSIHAPARGATSGHTRIALGYCLFQSTRPRGARHAGGFACVALGWFQSTRPRGARPEDLPRRNHEHSFNPRAREGRDAEQIGTIPLEIGFNPRAREGRDKSPKSFRCPTTCFNPRAREGRDCLSIFDHAYRIVSIHAPARGATMNAGKATCWPGSFNPRAREGRDRQALSVHQPVGCFNPRAREGRDFEAIDKALSDVAFQSTRPRGARLKRLIGKFALLAVSIHAPARGATWCGHRSGANPLCFNPRAREGRDRTNVGIPLDDHKFQSTRPRGARPLFNTQKELNDMFQSTRPRGARRERLRSVAGRVPVSIHAPARGATPEIYRRSLIFQAFQSTRPRGARPGP